jgi:glycosyltransferase involved in cell wall biosynthesis
LPGIVTNILHKFLPKIADAYFSCSLMASKWIFPEDKIKIKGLHILKNGIDSEKYTFNEQIRIRKRSEFALENKFIIGNVARFKLEKNQSFLVDVFLEILKINMNSILLFVGDGEERKNVERKVYLLGIQEKVLFLGIRYDVPDILQAMDAFVLPSLYEGLPVVGIEAQASGLPCFISDGVTVETDVTGNCFFLSVKEKPSVWAQMITNKSKKYVRKNTSQQIINSGYDIKKTAQEMQDFYLETYAVNF